MADDEERKLRSVDGGGEGDGEGKSLDDLAGEEPSEDELFPLGTLDGDPKKSLKNLIRAGVPVEVTASLMSAEVPSRGGLLDPEESGQIIVSYEVHKYEPVIERDSKTGKITRWKIRQHLRPTYVEQVQAPAEPKAGSG